MPSSPMMQWSRCVLIGLTMVACSDVDPTGPPAFDRRVSMTPGAWTTLAARPTVSAQGFAAQIGGRIYSVGGAHAHLGEPSTLHIYDPATDGWSNGAAPAATHAWSAAELGGQIYLFGGWDGGSVHTTTQIYNPLTDSWTSGTAIPRAHNNGIAAAIGGKIYVAAGGNSSGYVANTDIYDPVTDSWTQAAPLPQPRAFVAGGVINGTLYVVGGDNGTGRLATVHAYDPLTDVWSAKTSMPTARALATAVVFEDKLYVVGGSTQAAYTNPDYSASLTGVVEVYDPATDSWSTAAAMPTVRQAAHVAVANGVLYAIAGFGAGGSVAVNEAFGLVVAPPPPNDPATAQACTKGGWQAFGFRNQGQCVRFVQTGKDSRT